MKIKVSEATKLQLDWLVASIELQCKAYMHKELDQCWINVSPAGYEVFNPTTNWSLAGPLIDREKISVSNPNGDPGWVGCKATPAKPKRNGTPQWTHKWECGPTPLIAAMRCFVASKLGDEVEVPDELS